MLAYPANIYRYATITDFDSFTQAVFKVTASSGAANLHCYGKQFIDCKQKISIIKQITLMLSASLKFKDEKAFPWHATEITYIKCSNFSNKLPLQYLILPWLVLTSCLWKVRRAGLGAGDIGKTAASFSMHVRAGGRSLSQMPVYRSQRGLKITSSSTRTSVTPDSGRGRDGGPNDPCQDQAL